MGGPHPRLSTLRTALRRAGSRRASSSDANRPARSSGSKPGSQAQLALGRSQASRLSASLAGTLSTGLDCAPALPRRSRQGGPRQHPHPAQGAGRGQPRAGRWESCCARPAATAGGARAQRRGCPGAGEKWQLGTGRRGGGQPSDPDGRAAGARLGPGRRAASGRASAGIPRTAGSGNGAAPCAAGPAGTWRHQVAAPAGRRQLHAPQLRAAGRAGSGLAAVG